MEEEKENLFTLSIEHYHGRIPFLVRDIIDELNKLDAASEESLFDPDTTNDTFEDLVNQAKVKHIRDYSQFAHVGTLSITLIHFLNGITAKEPLVSKDILVTLLHDYLDESPHAIHHIRKTLVKLYPGRYRTILYITQFLGTVTSVDVDQLFRVFRQSFFGKDALKELKTDLRNLFKLLITKHADIFNGAILGNAAFLTERQITGLIKRHINHETSQFDQQPNPASPTSPTSGEMSPTSGEMSPTTPRNISMFAPDSRNPFNEDGTESDEQKSGFKEKSTQITVLTIAHQEVYEKEPDEKEGNKNKNLEGSFVHSPGRDPDNHRIFDSKKKKELQPNHTEFSKSPKNKEKDSSSASFSDHEAKEQTNKKKK